MAEKHTHDLRTQTRGETRLSVMGSAEGNSESINRTSRANPWRTELSKVQPALELSEKSARRYEIS
jgi:hypothetical protein